MIKKFSYIIIAVLFVLFLVAMGISACAISQPTANEEMQGEITEVSFPRPVDKQFPVLPFPPEYEMDRDQSFIYESGRGKVKVGGIHLTVFNTPDEMVSFYRSEMKDKGWRMVRMVDHKGTILVYEKKTLFCTITINPSAEKTRIIIHIGPK